MQIVEASGLTLLPGVIAPQVHFWEPGLEYKEDLSTASRASAKGGYLVSGDAQYKAANHNLGGFER
ncbi:hypothetical protein NDI45_21615 [Leptolyngbya sp. GB1-A1]